MLHTIITYTRSKLLPLIKQTTLYIGQDGDFSIVSESMLLVNIYVESKKPIEDKASKFTFLRMDNASSRQEDKASKFTLSWVLILFQELATSSWQALEILLVS